MYWPWKQFLRTSFIFPIKQICLELIICIQHNNRSTWYCTHLICEWGALGLGFQLLTGRFSLCVRVGESIKLRWSWVYQLGFYLLLGFYHLDLRSGCWVHLALPDMFSIKVHLELAIQNGLCCPLCSDKLTSSLPPPVRAEGAGARCCAGRAIFCCPLGCRRLLRELLSLGLSYKSPAQSSAGQPRQTAGCGIALLECCVAVPRMGRA